MQKNETGPLSFFLSLFLFILRKIQIVSWGGGGAEREGDRIPSGLRTVRTEPNAGLELMNHEIMT